MGAVKPLLSICIPTYNRLCYLKELLPRLIEQIRSAPDGEIELLVSDNASMDDTAEFLKKQVVPFLRYWTNSENIGGDRNFLKCVTEANGEYVWLVGDDDILPDGAVARVVQCLKEHAPALLISDQEDRSFDRVYAGYAEVLNDRSRSFVLDHTLISANVFRRALFDMELAEKKLWVQYAHMFGMMSRMGRERVCVLRQFIFRRSDFADFAKYPSCLCVKQGIYLWWIADRFNVSWLRQKAVLNTCNLPMEYASRLWNWVKKKYALANENKKGASKHRKRICIVTAYGLGEGRYNYGTSLQSFALLNKLLSLGYDAAILPERLSSDFITLITRPGYFLNFIRQDGIRPIFHYVCRKLFPRRHKENIASRTDDGVLKKMRDWSDRHYRVTNITSRGEWVSYLESVDCFVSGSDQMWNTYMRFNPFHFLYFVGHGKRVSYASSIGTAGINPSYADKVMKLLRKFEHISVRERAGLEALSELTGRDDIVHVLDPTFLMTDSEWITVANRVELDFSLPQRYILCYILSSDKKYIDQINEIRKIIGIEKIVVVPSFENPSFSVDGCLRYEFPTPSEFVSLIKNADFVCTDSFHGTAFSINLSKPFVVFKRFEDGDPKSQNLRIYELLGTFDLSSRIYEKHSLRWHFSIDWASVQRRLAVMREKSLEYLCFAIER